ncbi:prephenate dehydratase domain-containing protein [Desulfogranum japonicum]|uniref:prephenate dehydratase domain-containing protein n=1 Tax=Desulfogranum japonicum TaxID=231447 RepID=UPI000426ED5C|nr:prephenate dehydratase domain-containing protein [Desulfogranum japonicum]
MFTIATLGPEGSPAWAAAKQFDQQASIQTCTSIAEILRAFNQKEIDCILLPVYNTREGDNKQYFRLFEMLKHGYWIDNVIIHADLSLGVLDASIDIADIRLLVGRGETFSQGADYIDLHFSDIPQMHVSNVQDEIEKFREQGDMSIGFIESLETLQNEKLSILERGIATHNRTRFAVFAHKLAKPSGYDATTFVTVPLDDRVGLLVDILREFSNRGINIVDMRTENHVATQKLQIYIEAEGHIQQKQMQDAITHVETQVIQQKGAIRVLGSFPRIDMRTKHIRSFGFIGTGDMSKWFADRLESEGYDVFLTGRSTPLRPEEMVRHVDVVVICVPISVTARTIASIGPLLASNKALIILAGESEQSINTALSVTNDDVEVMLVHNLWGPQAATMKDKNAIIVKTSRSGLLCAEFEAFLYKHGADIYQDSAQKHDLLMGVGQKLPTAISVALALTLHENNITSEDLASHSTLTSLYPILAMARVHSQNPRTYAEILSTSGDGRKIVVDFIRNFEKIMQIAGQADIDSLSALIQQNAEQFDDAFLEARMVQAKAVDNVLGKMM